MPDNADTRELRFHCTSLGDFRATVCTSLTDAATVDRMNVENPDGSGAWHIADEDFGSGTLADGTWLPRVPNGTPCPDGVEGCRHVLLARGDESLRGDATPE